MVAKCEVVVEPVKILHLSSLYTPITVLNKERWGEIKNLTIFDPGWIGHIFIIIQNIPEENPEHVLVYVVRKNLNLEPVSGRDFLLLGSRKDIGSVFNTATSKKKKISSRRNGKLGGRPKVERKPDVEKAEPEELSDP